MGETDLDLPFVRGIDQSIAEEVLPADQRLSQLQDGEFSKLGEITHAHAFSRATLLANVKRLVPYSGGYLAFDGSSVYAVRAASLAVDNLKQHNTMRVKVTPVKGAESPDSAYNLHTSFREQAEYRVVVRECHVTVFYTATGIALQSFQLNNTVDTPCYVLSFAGPDRIGIVYTNAGNIILRLLSITNPTDPGSDTTLATNRDPTYTKNFHAREMNSSTRFVLSWGNAAGDSNTQSFAYDGTVGSAVSSYTPPAPARTVGMVIEDKSTEDYAYIALTYVSGASSYAAFLIIG
ncbi:MAG: hypothetical protein JRH20_24760, partial [Deltaproteobacteria bacterium]|nr:hypothetical protein [Deltaproteobacteria bacterium]